MEYKRIPMTPQERSNFCPICSKKRLVRTAKQTIYVYQRKDEILYYKTVVAELSYCGRCGLCCASPEIFAQIRKLNPGFSARGFSVSRPYRKEDIIAKCNRPPHRENGIRVKPTPYKEKNTVIFKESKSDEPELFAHPHDGFKDHPLRTPIKNISIYITNCDFSACPICGERIYKDTIQIPVSKTRGVDYNLFACGTHYFAYPSKK